MSYAVSAGMKRSLKPNRISGGSPVAERLVAADNGWIVGSRSVL